ncbi:antitoxin [Salipaludibacillus keqinensis]|uniref:Antitoxin n=2 Tax=Salipaludibacillus keqinensis TaxID=2045207 RepID=A0A323TB42_9BACI|nr:antitoxin [Salipaludibacillus keqinensis]
MSMDNTKKIMVNLPQHLVNELDALTDGEDVNRCEVIQKATKIYLQEQKKEQIRETMQQGYMEMAKINLNIATESFLAEEEAEITVDRLVSGV